jgi:primosomal protein N' (replication factor Y)
LLGTQMVTKGLDLPNVTLVGVLSADMGIDLPDFRAGERTFARLLQVAGRSGRGDSPGRVFIQTYYPESEVVQDAARQDYVAFFGREIESRRLLSFPPFSHLIRFLLSATDQALLQPAVDAFAAELARRIESGETAADILGPADCPISQLRGRRRQHLMVKTDRPVPLVRMLTRWETERARFGLPSGVRVTVDVDPDDMM